MLRMWRGQRSGIVPGDDQLGGRCALRARATAVSAIYTIEPSPPSGRSTTRRGAHGCREHLGPLAQMTAFLAGAAALIAARRARYDRGIDHPRVDRDRGGQRRAAAGSARGGADPRFASAAGFQLVDHAAVVPDHRPGGPLLSASRAQILDRHRWIVPAVIARVRADVRSSASASAAFLSGFDGALPALAWFATHGWTFEASFALCLAVNVLIVVEGIKRYRVNLDAERAPPHPDRRLHRVPAVFAYALKTGIPLLFGLLGRPVRTAVADRSGPAGDLPAAGVRTALCGGRAPRVQPAHGAASQPAVRIRAEHVDGAGGDPGGGAGGITGPATRPVACDDRHRTAAVLSVFPRDAGPRVAVSRSRRSAGSIDVSFATSTTRARSWCRWRDACHTKPIRAISSRWSSPRSIRRSTRKTSPCSRRIRRRDRTPPAAFAPVSTLRVEATPLRADSGVITLLRWSDKPLEVFLDDEQSPVARVPPADRQWLARYERGAAGADFCRRQRPAPVRGLDRARREAIGRTVHARGS